MSKKYFYDVHHHAFNLSHPNLTAFTSKLEFRKYLNINFLTGGILLKLGQSWLNKKILRVKNTLSLMDNDIGSMFLLLEYYLKNDPELFQNNMLNINGNFYDKMVITPLVIDFGYKGKSKSIDIAYNEPPNKPIVSQIEDLFSGIHFYLNYEIVSVTVNGEAKLKTKKLNGDLSANKEKKLFEIYPFMGINPDNYKTNKVLAMLTKYFGNYDNPTRQKFYDEMGENKGEIDELSDYSFIGIKLYPPMGYDPMKLSQNSVALFDFCAEKKIPIMVHCSNEGFLIDDKFRSFSNPNGWKNILKDENYKNLKICFAHLGDQKKKVLKKKKRDWENTIINYINDELNVYTDISCIAHNTEFYNHLKEIMNKNPKLKDHILFGTDFSINLLLIDSYNEYYKKFSENINDAQLIEKLCTTNTEKYLFG